MELSVSNFSVGSAEGPPYSAAMAHVGPINHGTTKENGRTARPFTSCPGSFQQPRFHYREGSSVRRESKQEALHKSPATHHTVEVMPFHLKSPWIGDTLCKGRELGYTSLSA